MTPIGTADAPFSGKLDGNNHTISGLSITQSYYVSHIGLFGSLAGQVTDLTLEDCHISVSSSSTSVSVGGIVGTANAPVRSCDVELEVTLSPNTTSKSCPIASGGIVGSAEGSIDQCWNRGEVVARAESSRTSSELASYMVAYAGGIAGRAAGSISDCFNTAYIAGFAHAISTNTYGAVSSTTYVGGVAGHCAALQRCYSIASVYSGNIANRPFIGDYNGRITIYCGAVAGMVTDTAADCHYLESMPHAFGSADADCEADSITSLTRQDTYRQFDFDAVWQFVDGDYAFPVLRAVPFTLPAHNGAAFSGGVGTLTDPYLITTVEQLRLISQDLSAAYRLDADLRVGSWTPLGLSDAAPFTGYLDGNGHTLSGVILQETEEDYCGFFGCSVGLIENLTLSGLQCSFTGGSHLGDWPAMPAVCCAAAPSPVPSPRPLTIHTGIT